MDALDLFPAAGIRFVPTVHEQGAAHMADGYSRVTGRHGVCIAQNGPGITNFVTGVAAACWAHSPVVAITPETGTSGMGLGGFRNRATADLLAHHQVPGARQPRRPHGRVHGQGFRQRHGRARPGAAEHPARLLLWRDRRGDSRAAPRASRSGRRGRPGGGGQAAGRGALPGDRGRRRRAVLGRAGRVRGAGRAAGRTGGDQLSAQRRLSVAPSAVVRPAGLPGRQGRHEAPVRGRRGAGAGARGSGPSAPCRSTGWITGPRTPASSRWTPTIACWGWCARCRWASAATPSRRRRRWRPSWPRASWPARPR